MADHDITVIGAGLAGCELTWQLAQAGLRVRLREMKPQRRTPAQVSDFFAELVCSNSFRSRNVNNAVGLLKEEMLRLGSFVLSEAVAHRVPAGDALAVDRVRFGEALTRKLRAHPNVVVEEVVQTELPPASEGPVVLCTGPLTDAALAEDLARATGSKGLYFYDAIAPIVAADSLERAHIFEASRWDKGDGADYLNCPLDKAQYDALVAFLREADCYPAHAFEEARYFSGCQPMEVIAAQGHDALRFGPLKPVGLTDPKTGRWPHAVVQLRAEDNQRRAYNLVGLQTKMRHGAQRTFLSMVPGLAGCEVLRYGAMHRNTYVDAPAVLDEGMALQNLAHVRLAGQITGVEGYVESAASGLLLALRLLGERAQNVVPLPAHTALGALHHHVRGTHRLAGRAHEPQNVNWGMFPEVPWPGGGRKAGKAAQKAARVALARQELAAWAAQAHVALAPIDEAPSTAGEQVGEAQAALG